MRIFNEQIHSQYKLGKWGRGKLTMTSMHHLKNKQQNNYLANTVLCGSGLSLDFVSYYDLVLRMEYSINRLNEKGLFLHFIAPI